MNPPRSDAGRLTEPQRRLLAEVEGAGVLYIRRHGSYYRTAQALVRKGALVVSEPDYSTMAQDGYSVPQSIATATPAGTRDVPHSDGYPATEKDA